MLDIPSSAWICWNERWDCRLPWAFVVDFETFHNFSYAESLARRFKIDLTTIMKQKTRILSSPLEGTWQSDPRRPYLTNFRHPWDALSIVAICKQSDLLSYRLRLFASVSIKLGEISNAQKNFLIKFRSHSTSSSPSGLMQQRRRRRARWAKTGQLNYRRQWRKIINNFVESRENEKNLPPHLERDLRESIRKQILNGIKKTKRLFVNQSRKNSTPESNSSEIADWIFYIYFGSSSLSFASEHTRTYSRRREKFSFSFGWMNFIRFHAGCLNENYTIKLSFSVMEFSHLHFAIS